LILENVLTNSPGISNKLRSCIALWIILVQGNLLLCFVIAFPLIAYPLYFLFAIII
jgi:hypothetical protein